MSTTKQEISRISWVNLIAKLKVLFSIIESEKITKGAAITSLGDTTDLPAIAGVYADLEEARASVSSLRAGSETRLAAVEAKVDVIIAALKTAGVIA